VRLPDSKRFLARAVDGIEYAAKSPLVSPPMTETGKSLCAGRRAFLKFALLNGATLAPAAARAASFKVTKKQAGYILKGKNATQNCAQCLYFISPNDCVVVQGPVSPLGWCTYYGD